MEGANTVQNDLGLFGEDSQLPFIQLHRLNLCGTSGYAATVGRELLTRLGTVGVVLLQFTHDCLEFAGRSARNSPSNI